MITGKITAKRNSMHNPKGDLPNTETPLMSMKSLQILLIIFVPRI